ncbi:uncharacterized protein F4822DRAFT_396516 [Hypoxylon trugodes]|uniref:uncharacterized protein n=1 Tax=Hypoxylon trugodes TaxID=326681 RepID=UPI0021A0CEFB|nr:uncharacterized protein F4822DRAFT_396516 [Hypoxylon trugodes]KAI1391365.1 hypothetical protein F4822DRAFT_396516 [Hypoxylon trugodes]
MASDQVDPAAASSSTTFTLQVISPSFGIPQPLALQDIPADLTVKQLKERIRNAINMRPTDQAQRLIHRGRLLAQDSETMTDIFGREAIRSTDRQSLHLVLRDLSDVRPTSTQSSFHNGTQTPITGQQPIGGQVPPQGQPQQRRPVFQLNMGAPPFPQNPVPGIHFTAPFMGQPANPPNVPQHQYNQWLRAMNHPQPQQQAPQGPQNIPSAGLQTGSGTNTPGRTGSPFQSDNTRTTFREGNGPNGLQWRVTLNETFINPLQRPGRTGSPFSAANNANPWVPPPHPALNSAGRQLSDNEVEGLLQALEAGSATRTMTDAMRRNASSSSLANLPTGQVHPIPPGVTTPLIPSRVGSATATPDPFRGLRQTRGPPVNLSHAQSSQGTPEVYILNSPTGPRAILLQNGSEAYFTPQNRTLNQPMNLPLGQRPFPSTLFSHLNPQHTTPTPTTQPQISTVGRGQQANNAAQPQPQPPQAHPQVQIGHAVARADNPQVQAIRIAQLWPHINMVIRLGLFIWWFTSPSSSWTRWITVISIAIILFLINTGLLNPLAEQFWVPLRRHLENLIPHGDGHQQGAQAPARTRNAQGANGDAAANPAQQEREFSPVDTAARLVQQRRNANANWLMDQARRLERAGILFLASIAPGVAERHIAQMEAEVRAERRRREAEVAAAATAAQEAERAEGAEQSTANGTTGGESGEQSNAAADEGSNERPPAPEEPLIAV